MSCVMNTEKKLTVEIGRHTLTGVTIDIIGVVTKLAVQIQAQ